MTKKVTKEMRPEHLKVHVWDIMRLIPDEEFAKLAKDMKTDYCAKVLTGERMIYMFIYTMLMSSDFGLRGLANAFKCLGFHKLFNVNGVSSVAHSSISERLKSMDVQFFQKAYEILYEKVRGLYTEKEIKDHYLVRVDSSMVAESCNKLKQGMTVGRKPASGKKSLKQVKYTMAYDGKGVSLAKLFDQPSYLCEDIAMPSVIEDLIKKDSSHRNLYVFDRGIKAKRIFDSFNSEGALFVGRIKTNRNMEVVKSLLTGETDRDLGHLTLTDDIAVHLHDNEKRAYGTETYRVLKMEFKEPRDTSRAASKENVKRTKNKIYLITNDFSMTPQEVAEAYRKRWDIEVFYRFLKQNLNFSHLLSTNSNGIQIVMYMTLMTYMLIMIFKRENERLCNYERIFFFKSAKLCLQLELQDWLMKLSIVMSGREPDESWDPIVLRTTVP